MTPSAVGARIARPSAGDFHRTSVKRTKPCRGGLRASVPSPRVVCTSVERTKPGHLSGKAPLGKGPARERRQRRKKRPQRPSSHLPCRPQRGPGRLSGNPGAGLWPAGGVVMRYRYTSESIPQSRSASQPPLHKGAFEVRQNKRPFATTTPAAKSRFAARTRNARPYGGNGSLMEKQPFQTTALSTKGRFAARADVGIGPDGTRQPFPS